MMLHLTVTLALRSVALVFALALDYVWGLGLEGFSLDVTLIGNNDYPKLHAVYNT